MLLFHNILLAVAIFKITFSSAEECPSKATDADGKACEIGVISIKDYDDLKKRISDAGDTKLVVVAFYARWCKWSKLMAPKVENLATKLNNLVVFVKVDVDDLKQVTKDYGVEGYPTFVLIKSSVKVEKMAGPDIEDLERTIRQNM